jgi:hypothetical protein
MTNRSLAAQNHIQVGAINAVVPCKRDLTSLALNCGSQQRKNLIIIKCKHAPAQTVGANNGAYFVIGHGGHWPVPTSDKHNHRSGPRNLLLYLRTHCGCDYSSAPSTPLPRAAGSGGITGRAAGGGNANRLKGYHRVRSGHLKKHLGPELSFRPQVLRFCELR